MKRHHILPVLATLATALLFAGCWGSSKSTTLQITGGSSVADTATAVGIDKCFTCHAGRLDVSNPADNGVTIFNMWANSKHGNPDPQSHASYANFADPTCGGARCHDPNGDGMKMLQLGPLGSLYSTAANRPVVGCEACHGGGSEHFGVGPMAYPFPNATACGQCHNVASPPQAHITFHQNGFGGKGNPGIFEAYSASPHAVSINSHVYADAAKTTVIARCAKCHTDEGARKFRLIDNVATGSPIDCAVLNPALANVNNVQCRTCHKAHGAGGVSVAGVVTNDDSSLLKRATGVVGTSYKSAQYNTCTACHQEVPQIHSPTDPLYPHPNQITANHAVGNTVLGIIVNDNAATACTECHNPHSADLTENRQLMASGHGDNTLNGAWNEGFTTNVSSSYCQRCHTTTVYVDYTTDQTLAYNSAVHTAAFAANGTVRNGVTRQETLYCRACHKPASTGFTVARRTPQAARIPGDSGAGITSANYTTIYAQIAGYGDSELCMNCHSGRLGRNGTVLPSLVTAKTTGLVSIDNIAMPSGSHNMPSLWAVFQDNVNLIGAYRLPGKNYNNLSYYAHNKIGTTAALDHSGNPLWTDNSTGPCVGCHMSSPNVTDNATTGKHSFKPVAKDNNDVIVAVTSTTCVKCHAGAYALTPASLEEAKGTFNAHLAEFDAALLTQGILRVGSSFKNASDNSALVTWATKAVAIRDNTAGHNTITSTLSGTSASLAGVDLLGICWNFQYLDSSQVTADAGIWAHNNAYANRLVYDAIEALGIRPSFTRP